MSLDSNLLSHVADQDDGNEEEDISEEDSDNGDETEVTAGSISLTSKTLNFSSFFFEGFHK